MVISLSPILRLFRQFQPSPTAFCLSCADSVLQLEKYKRLDFGKCPRVACASHPLLPTGLSDLPHIQSVKLYCGKCEDLYNPKSSRHATIDGAYFGTSFQNILFQVYPALAGEKSTSSSYPSFLILRPGLLAEWGAACLETTSCPREGLALMVQARRRPLRTPNFRFPRARRRSIRAMASAQAGRDGRALESRRDHQCLRRGSGGGRGRGDGGGRRWCGGVISELRKAGTER